MNQFVNSVFDFIIDYSKVLIFVETFGGYNPTGYIILCSLKLKQQNCINLK